MSEQQDLIGDRPRIVHETVVVEAPIERAFRVFTEQCHAWWPRSYRLGLAERDDVVLQPREGGRWYERSVDGKECDWGVVLVWQPSAHLSLSWQIGIGFVPEPDPGRASRVDVTFAIADAQRVTVTVIHSELERHGDGWEAMAEGVSGERGWRGILRAYKQVVASA
jgi:uncharacterized protein YndB with AHSA1/START domain